MKNKKTKFKKCKQCGTKTVLASCPYCKCLLQEIKVNKYGDTLKKVAKDIKNNGEINE